MKCVAVKNNPFTKTNKTVPELVNKSSRPYDMKIAIKINKLSLTPKFLHRFKDLKADTTIRSIVT